MHSKRTRLDRFISQKTGLNRRDTKYLLAQQRIMVDGRVATEVTAYVDEFTHVTIDAQVLQAKLASYLMLHKPAGILSATKDDRHPTVLELIAHQNREQLHLVGRLDINSTGLILLTNDGRWSRQLTHPESSVIKHYRVSVAQPLDDSYIAAFAKGFYFAYENITTRPARLKIIDSYTADVFLTEGRYHQIKRMFGRFQNEVLTLERRAIGNLTLDPSLPVGQYRELTAAEVTQLTRLAHSPETLF